MKILSYLFFFLSVFSQCYYAKIGNNLFSALKQVQMISKTKPNYDHYYDTEDINAVDSKKETVYVGSQKGRKEADKIDRLFGQPDGVNFSQYSGYVTVDPSAGRALFYYFAEAEDSSTKPLVLWLNGGPGCSSMGGAMNELGPFRVKPDGKSLWYNKDAWNNVANVLFLESPAGVGFSYSNTSSDYVTGDTKTASDSYTFLLNWLKRFPEYRTRDFFITGESYAGHYVPQLAKLILRKNKNTANIIIKLIGIAIGNPYIHDKDFLTGMYDHFWTSALISGEIHQGIKHNCNFSAPGPTDVCKNFMDKADNDTADIYIYDIYAPKCGSSPSPSISSFDPCTENYTSAYLNNPEAQKALHANITGHPGGKWQDCSDPISKNWTDMPRTVLPDIKKLMASGIRVLIYSGDTDGIIPVTTTLYSLPRLDAHVKTKWYPWFCENQVGGYAVGYEKNLTFVTIKGSGHFVPSYQPRAALTFFTSFLQGQLPPRKTPNKI